MADDDNPQEKVSEPAGEQLRRARETKGLSVAAVADAQHLRPAVIQAIENGDYSQIDSELFLKGYVRAYARQVDLDPNEVVATLDTELEPLRREKAEAQQANPLVDIERRRRRKRQVAKLVFWILVLVVAGYLAMRFLGDPAGEAAAPPEPAEETQESDVPEERTDLLDEDALDNGDTSEEPSAVEEPVADTGEGEGDVSIAANGSDAVQANEPNIAGEQEGPATPATSDDSDTENGVDTFAGYGDSSVEGATPVEDAVEDRIPAVTNTADPALAESNLPSVEVERARLVLSFTDNCWVQITDAVGNKLVSSLQREGDRIEVTGRAPLEVVIGAVDAVDIIRFQGEPVDMSRFRVFNNRAQFTLDI